MKIHENKTKEQNLVLDKWTHNKYKGTWLAATGCGKTLCGVRAIVNTIKENPKANALVIVPTENLRDNEWYNEFVNWGCDQYLNNVEISCIQTAYKYESRHYDIVIVDEVHMAVSPEYRNFFFKNKYERLLCLTATIDDEEKMQFITSIAPIIHITSIDRALSLGLIANFIVYNLSVHLSDKSKSLYAALIKQYNEYERLLGGKFKAFSTAAAVIKQIKDIPKDLRTDEQKVMYQNACVFWGVMNRRKMFLYNLPEKISITKDIINMFPDRKSIVFSESIKFATKLQQSIGSTAVVYHSKMTKNQRVQTLKAFEIDESRVRTLCSVRALNVGLNVPEASLGIGASGNSKWLDQMQRNGRVARYAENKLAIYVNLYAYDTQEVKWVFSRTKKLNSDNVRWITKVDEIKF